jgi:hypothetical protein
VAGAAANELPFDAKEDQGQWTAVQDTAPLPQVAAVAGGQYIGRGCASGGRQGSCQSFPGGCNGEFTNAPVCPGPDNIRCCLQAPPPPSDPNAQYIGRGCPGGSCQYGE